MFTASHGISSSGPETRQINSPQLIITSTNRKRLRLPKTLNGAEENVKEEVWGCYKMEEGWKMGSLIASNQKVSPALLTRSTGSGALTIGRGNIVLILHFYTHILDYLLTTWSTL